MPHKLYVSPYVGSLQDMIGEGIEKWGQSRLSGTTVKDQASDLRQNLLKFLFLSNERLQSLQQKNTQVTKHVKDQRSLRKIMSLKET